MTGKQVIEIFKAHGWSVDRINGSHHIMVKEGCRSIPIPVHGNEDLGVRAKKILKQADIEV